MLRLRSATVFLALLLCFFIGCGKKTPGTVRPEESKKPVVRLIAVLPVENKSSDVQAARILRERILEEIFFKGYPKIPLSVLDEKLSGSYKSGAKVPPKIVGDLLKVDAVFYCTLEEWKTTYGLVSARTTVSARFELRNAKTGETIWKSRGKETRKNYDVTRKGQEMKSFLDYEQIVAEIVDKAMASFPDGPDFIGRPPAKKGCWLWNWF
ncbi:MAG: DUF799 family lipoprotein [Syntrophobacterales bacterium]|jgi:hypothetical protein|nr:DUF799 family lipoprotein [Syntrophobacterales bacterium]